MADQINYYQVLGVPREASQEEIRIAYRTLAKDRHPDRVGGSTEEFSLLQEAYAVLSDPNRRRQHDEALDLDRKSTRLNSSHANISYAVFCLKKQTSINHQLTPVIPMTALHYSF